MGNSAHASAALLLEPETEKGAEPFYFKTGLPGLEPYRSYHIKKLPENDCFLLLQAVEEPEVELILVDPYLFYSDYCFKISDVDRQDLKVESKTELLILTTVSAGENTLFTNLAAPILINPARHLGKQLILAEMQEMLRSPLKLSSDHTADAERG